MAAAATAVPYESIQAYCDAHIQGHNEAAEAKAVAACNAGKKLNQTSNCRLLESKH
jgi:hypothetical protein